ncbi:CoA transferase [Streptomyces sp. C11-1]|uniref:CoA transferase n=1 Tax=Streptomyces durocortorensis TaxID=2811104 RepID=A0ABY9VRU6_9ACTN|nr:CoA transferase [Streptomyces durocortorensis]WNF26325.1 CoA transferase [Streptomyces durocortorensis]
MTHTSAPGASAPDAATPWAALGGDPALLDRVDTGGPAGLLGARLPVMELARSAVAVCALAAAELAAHRSGVPVPRVRVDDGAVATAFISERHLRIDGRAPVSFAPLSRFWRTAEGWVRTHANYPHHRARLLSALGLPEDATPETVAGVFAERQAVEIEETVYAAGGLAVALRSPEEWTAHPQGAAVAARPLATLDRLGAPTAPRPLTSPSASLGSPAAGLRVLDLTRVIAGPVATRTLALLGADVLRVDAPQLPESQDAHSDTGFGKRSTRLDLGTRSDRAVFEELLASADVLVTGYRPGALDAYGLAPDALAERHPALVLAQLSAWGTAGPWHGRRGFDSLVQVATGIAAVEGTPQEPGALPAQALDHGTGYLLAAGVLRSVTEQGREGGTRLLRASLAGTAQWLLSGGRGGGSQDEARAVDASYVHAEDRAGSVGTSYNSSAYLTTTAAGPLGEILHALSPVALPGGDGGPADWSRPPGRLGADAPEWRTRTGPTAN